jgi:ABC-type transport system involved in multi-copper enzyme maturation permease subunit
VSRLIAVAANTYRETVRERVLYNLVFFAILMTLSGLFLAELSVRQDDRIIKDIGLASMELFGTFIAIFVGVGLVSKEIERRSLYPLLAKPLTRTEFLLGKFCGLGLTLLVNCACSPRSGRRGDRRTCACCWRSTRSSCRCCSRSRWPCSSRR